ncbi:palmitoyltransferase SWF1, putative [Entamoeba invadens IP1]|uniref:Palmitoyltransferase n=1 Tax=Entamoeba invadens IP1 TaxID=370355 RepID=A0A0A1U4G4_ENTIV|nr:palmitoyltransferase SWF1, putative [Entamoeba invadens IP1]ELP89055.1 palmitoyltransferase SWF1, putative [Entamoeba invadens IP1]|eukprot:XP_004255826.1 palmitoyltransferase SWF1, putative [Entamoeba invadens IP1]
MEEAIKKADALEQARYEIMNTNPSFPSSNGTNKKREISLEKFQGLVGLVPLGIPPLLLFFYFTFYFFVIKYFALTYSTLTMTLLVVLSHYELYSMLYHWYKCYTVPSDEIPIDYFKQYTSQKNTVEHCSICKKDKYPRTHHCSICGKCVVRYDHHCAWLSCIGLHNVRYFALFLFNGAFTTGIYMTMLGYVLYDQYNNANLPFKTLLVMTIMTFNTFLTCGFQTVFQFVCISLNLTMVDVVVVGTTWFKGNGIVLPWYITFIENWREALRVRKDLSLFWYLLPYTPTRGINTEELDDVKVDV